MNEEAIKRAKALLDLKTRKSWVYVTHKHSSMQASNVMKYVNIEIPCVQTDNVSEFLKNFHAYCVGKKMPSWFFIAGGVLYEEPRKFSYVVNWYNYARKF